MSNSNKISTKFEIPITEKEEYLKMKIDKYKAETSSSIGTKLLALNSNKYISYYDQPSSNLIK